LKHFWKNLGYHHLDGLPLSVGIFCALVLGIASALVCRKLVARLQPGDELSISSARHLYITRALSKAIMHLRRARNTADGDMKQAADDALQQTQAIHKSATQLAGREQTHSSYRQVERIFIFLQIISASFVAFAHGANDVANAIGPMSVVVEMAWSVPMQVPEQTTVSTAMLALGGFGIVVGLATWGWRVMQTVGSRITELTPSRGFSAEFAAALTILVASVCKLPISTTHTLVGAVLGVGLARGIGALNMRTVRDILISWVVTVPAGAILAVVFFYGLRLAVGH
jgi:PiT family inorganic phosphate transporter